jgi:hypothetical protein
MTAGILASIPFWIIAGVVLYVTIACPLKRNPGETTNMLLAQFFFFLFLTGVFSAIAAFVMHL